MWDILQPLFQKWHLIPKPGVCFVVWDLTWHKIYSHLLSPQPPCSQANTTAAAMLAGLGWPNIVEKDQRSSWWHWWQAWECQLLQDTNKHHLAPAVSVPQDVSLIPCFLSAWACLEAKMSNLLPLISPLFWHIACSPWDCGYFDFMQMEKNWSVWLLQQRCFSP